MGNDRRRRFCCDEDLELIGYDGHHAAEDVARWRRCGPDPATQELIEVIRANDVDGATVLDIGAGVGIIHLSLLEAGAARAIDVDASQDYLAAARAEAGRRGLADRVDYRYGDVVELAEDLPPVEVVTLDSVLCCYPYLAPLLRAAISPHPRLVGLTYPRDSWWMRLFMRAYNVRSALRDWPDHYYIHRRAEVDRLLGEAGFVGIHSGGTRTWRVMVYRRGGAERDQPRSADASLGVAKLTRPGR
jgi:SAM-dependent methyltransferase